MGDERLFFGRLVRPMEIEIEIEIGIEACNDFLKSIQKNITRFPPFLHSYRIQTVIILFEHSRKMTKWQNGCT